MRSKSARASLTGAIALTMFGAGMATPAHAAAPAESDTSSASGDLVPETMLNNLRASLDAIGAQAAAGGNTAATCGDTNFSVWENQQTAGWTKKDAKAANTMVMLTALDATYFPESKTRIGEKGQYTSQMVREMKRLRGFWDINGQNIGLSGMHSTVLKSKPRLIRLLTATGEASRSEASTVADRIVRTVNTPKFDYGNNPLLTENAFSSPASVVKGRHYKARIVMGDGILQGTAALGWKNEGPQEVLAHEYGHQNQFAHRMAMSTKTTAKQSQYIELMADAYAGYFLRHAKGENHGWGTMATYEKVAYATGDCEFTAKSHHGTPDQRMASATWGASLAGYDHKVRTTGAFANSFRGAYPRIVKH